MTNQYLRINPEIQDALAHHRPVVALESTLITHGLPQPENLQCAKALEATIRQAGAIPATIGICGGQIVIGLDEAELERFAGAGDVAKVSRRDLAAVIAEGRDGATTVAATMICARLAGISVFATGGIGGVHRGGETSMDISADLMELGRTPVTVVCAGAKSILDPPRTLEVLETQGVPVTGFGTNRFPGFYLRDSGLALNARADSAAQIARLMEIRQRLGMAGGMVVAVPIPEGDAIAATELEQWTATAMAEAERAGVSGKNVTPFLLSRIANLSDGRTVKANLALVRNNAGVAAAIAKAFSRLTRACG